MVRSETPRIAIVGAMRGEIDAVRSGMRVDDSGREAGFNWWEGSLEDRPVLLAQAGMGKVAAGACVQRLIDKWNIKAVVVCGLAGGLDDRLRPGDIVVADALMQHDVDASPIFPRFQLPGLEIDTLLPPEHMVEAGMAAAAGFLAENPLSSAVLAANGVSSPRVLRGLIATGDQFVEDRERAAIVQAIPAALCVEMEGAAIAQVCHLNDVACCVIRIMSDNADDSAAFDFLRFVEDVAPVYVYGIVTRLMPLLPG